MEHLITLWVDVENFFILRKLFHMSKTTFAINALIKLLVLTASKVKGIIGAKQMQLEEWNFIFVLRRIVVKSLETCSSYNTCENNRQGRLCGGCKYDYLISLFGPNKCIEKEKCKNSLFWIGYVLLILIACLLLMYYEDLIKKIKFWLKRTTERLKMSTGSNDAEGKPILNGTVSPYYMLRNESDCTTTATNDDGEISGILKIAFFFYQTASIIIWVNASAKAYYYTTSYVIDLILSIFNIKIDVDKLHGHVSDRNK